MPSEIRNQAAEPDRNGLDILQCATSSECREALSIETRRALILPSLAVISIRGGIAWFRRVGKKQYGENPDAIRRKGAPAAVPD
jgi:hypothetical protein